MKGLISRIIPFSCVDGPGNRFVIFLQGCNFRCKNCHNPHTIGRCDACGECVPGCPAGALSLMALAGKKQILWDETLCQSCDRCTDQCPASASPMTRLMSVDELLAQILTAAPFLTGVTVSGGESTMQLKFVCQLFRAMKCHPQLSHLSCLIDSNGFLSVNTWQSILPVFDGAMIDLKAMDNDLHTWLTGQGNQRVLDSIRFLHQHKKLTELRFLAIPEITDTEPELAAIRHFLAELGEGITLKVNAFSNKAVAGEAKQWRNLSAERAQAIRSLLSERNGQ